MDFGALPPEINSARMYAGPGAGPMMASSVAWSNLAAALGTMASGCHSVALGLTGEEWLGPASAAMAAAVAPYVAWMNTTAADAGRAAGQAMASAAAYETAFAMTVPPPLIAANRSLMATLVATNILGLNGPAIAATEAHYAEMWAQDAAAMYGYAASSAQAGALTPLTSPAPVANPTAMAGQATAATGGAQASLSQVVSTLPDAVGQLANPLTLLTGSSDPMQALRAIDAFLGVPAVSNAINGSVNTAAWFVMNTIPTAVALGNTLGASAPAAAGLASAGPVVGGVAGGVLAGATAPVATVSPAAMGQASAVGALSVPAAWAEATQAAGAAPGTVTGSGWAPEPEAMPEAVPGGIPAAGSAQRSGGFDSHRYGVKPKMVPKTVFG